MNNVAIRAREATKKVFLFGAMLCMLVACNGGNGVTQPKKLKLNSTEVELKESCNDFSFNLLAQVANNDQNENVILSPLSASMLLGMLMNGADGETLAQMQAVTGFGSDVAIEDINAYYRQLMDVLPALDKYTNVNLANGIWVREDFPVRETFVEACKKSFDAEAKNVPSFLDDKVLEEINKYAAMHTNNRIKKVIDKSMVNENTAMALLNALYFKSIWDVKFKKSNTNKQAFTTLKGENIQTDMMHNTEEWQYGESKEYQLVELPYKGDAYCADIILPAEGIDIRTWVKSLNAESWENMVSEKRKTEVALSLPKFSLNYSRKLNDDLKTIGMTDAFDELKANFYRLSETPSFLDLIQQYTFMQVDEEGTEAAAVTVGIVAPKASCPDFATLTVDRPFLFVIREREYGTILFTALIGHPDWQK